MYARFNNGKNPGELPTINDEVFTTSLDERIEELKRDIDERQKLYPILVKDGKLDPLEASRRLECLQDILKDLYDQKYIGAPRHKQLVIFEDPPCCGSGDCSKCEFAPGFNDYTIEDNS